MAGVGTRTLKNIGSKKKIVSPKGSNFSSSNRKKLEYETLYAKIKFQDMDVSDTQRNASQAGSKVANTQESIGSLDSFLISHGANGLEPKETNVDGIVIASG